MANEKIAFVFPGQGSQVVGMGRELAEAFPEVKARFDEANDILGFDLTKLCFEGPDSELQKTEFTQPALLATSYAFLELIHRYTDLQPDFVAGHSLGEYTALVAADSIGYADALRTVSARGSLMKSAVPEGVGGMLAIIGLDSDEVAALCADVKESGSGHVEPATLNAPDQTVAAGELSALEVLAERAREAGARRVVPLNVSGPFHSALLRPAGERLADELEKIEIRDPKIPVIANVTGEPVHTADAIRDALVTQVSAPVRWVESVRYMIDQGVTTFLEIGSGKVLCGLIRRIDRSVTTLNFEDVKSWDRVLAWAKGVM